jgi:hypothetical protein
MQAIRDPLMQEFAVRDREGMHWDSGEQWRAERAGHAWQLPQASATAILKLRT